MKTKMFKFVLPAFAILLAVGLAFATETPSVDRVAYYKPFNQPWQSITVGEDCFQGGAIQCKHLGYQLYESPDLTSTALSKP